jgi:hypothetical protein
VYDQLSRDFFVVYSIQGQDSHCIWKIFTRPWFTVLLNLWASFLNCRLMGLLV